LLFFYSIEIFRVSTELSMSRHEEQRDEGLDMRGDRREQRRSCVTKHEHLDEVLLYKNEEFLVEECDRVEERGESAG